MSFVSDSDMMYDALARILLIHPLPAPVPAVTLLTTLNIRPHFLLARPHSQRMIPEEPAPQTSSELIGALGQEPTQNGVFNQGPYSNIFNPSPGPYYPDYLSLNFHLAGGTCQ